MTGTLPEMWAVPLHMGWSVIPLRQRDKRPAIGSWAEYQRHGPSRELVDGWASRGCNVGIVTGDVSGLLVLDLDSHGALMEAERLGLPYTVAASTAKGRHCYFQHPGGKVKNRAGLFPGADIRADGGFVVGPGSIHPSGRPYEWIASPLDSPLAAPPQWLMDALAPPATPLPPQRPQAPRSASIGQDGGDCTPYGHAALQRESEAIRRAMNGSQETTLNNAGLKIGALVAGGEVSRATARMELVRAGMCMANYDPRNLWTLEAITAKVERALADGAAHPRTAPEPREAAHG